jgi:methionine-gamma-lyase
MATHHDDPEHRLMAERHEFGEYGGVNCSIEVSTTFTVLEASTLPSIFQGEVGPEKGARVGLQGGRRAVPPCCAQL